MGELPQRLSPDGHWWWDGSDWRSVVSPDGWWRWNGERWVAARAQPQRAGPRTGMLVALIATGAVVVLVAASVLTYAVVTGLNNVQKVTSSSTAAGGIPCDLLEHTQVHYHAALQILNAGAPVDIPTDIGRRLGCYYWLHMHDFEPGIIHIEAPLGRAFTLGDFFAVWSAWSGQPQPLDATHVGSIALTGAESLVAFIDLGDGSGPQTYGGDPRTIVLQQREVITLEISPPSVSPPPTFDWPSGF